ncbi:glycosyl hydrolase [Alteromonas sp. a30]|uniref:glycosyl hydrolase n=1 Tax=Alteromonas sp. a30 TaxID=2730917 RepID=UPI002280B814|nr:glycosyl hydrolase [Alteromonas sp. a30]MCY7297090.1 glucan 1,3-beta-glucanase [Alteromonas sp. a30]
MLLRTATLATTILCSQIGHAAVIGYGQGSISDTINPASHKCVVDHGNWIFNAGVVRPAIAGCNGGVPVGQAEAIVPQLVSPASEQVTAAHRWWGSIAYFGEMKTNNPDDAGHITSDPFTLRVTEKGVRMMSIPGGLQAIDSINVGLLTPDPFAEVFDGIAVGNSAFSNMEAAMKDHSDGSVTVQWSHQGQAVMEATFVHGSPYAYFTTHQGNLVIRSKAGTEGGEKGVFYQQDNTLGMWTDVAGNRGSFLIVGDGPTSFSGVDSQAVQVNNSSNRLTVALLPIGDETPSGQMIQDFKQYALNKVDKVNINYSVNRANNNVTVTHEYVNAAGQPVNSLVGMMPMHWKNSSQPVSQYQTRSARGMIKYAATNGFSYDIPYLGVLPFFPKDLGDVDPGTLQNLVNEFIALGEDNWDSGYSDTYWAPKTYAKVAEVQAIARDYGLTAQADQLLNFLKAELADWFTANNNGTLDASKYFYYDQQWNTLLGFDESFGAQQQLNDHHFHYGYFVRVAAEICRVDANWCSDSQYGPMVELLIRDYAAGRDDPMFPYLRHFDPANGFSWASGHANFVRGNNNESTSEAANAYGAMVLYGMITNNQDLVDRGMYLHASTMESFWQYWNNIDRHLGQPADHDNFPSSFTRPTTSIIWGDGHVFSTWFSGAYAHILGIQGLPLNPLVMHLGLYPDYLKDYVALGLSESSNGRPSGLPADQWRDIWWNIWALTDADAAIADHQSMNFNYTPETGDSKAHTYHWIHTMRGLGHIANGKGNLTANDPMALIFNKNGGKTYIAYNYGSSVKRVEFSDGMAMNVAPGSFGIKRPGDNPDSPNSDQQAPSQPGNVSVGNVTQSSAQLNWSAASDNVGVAGYRVSFAQGSGSSSVSGTSANLTGLTAGTNYQVLVRAFDAAGNESSAAQVQFTTPASNDNQAPSVPQNLTLVNQDGGNVSLSWQASSDNVAVSSYRLYQNGSVVSQGAALSAQINGLAPGSYAFNVSAVDSSGNESATSNTVNVVVDNNASSSQFTFEGSLPNGLINGQPVTYQATASFNAATSMVTIEFVSNTLLDTVWAFDPGFNDLTQLSGTHFSVDIPGYSAGQTINWYFVARTGEQQADNVTAQHSWTIGASSADSVAPSTPAGLSISAQNGGDVTLQWNNSSDNVGVTGYKLYSNGAFVLQTGATSASVTGLADGSYNFTVSAIDAAGNESAQSSAVNVSVSSASTFDYQGNLPNGLIDGQRLSYSVTGSFNAGTGVATFVFESAQALDEVWFYNPGFNNMTKESSTRFSVQVSGAQAGQTIQWYFVARKSGQQADNVTAQHQWTL